MDSELQRIGEELVCFHSKRSYKEDVLGLFSLSLSFGEAMSLTCPNSDPLSLSLFLFYSFSLFSPTNFFLLSFLFSLFFLFLSILEVGTHWQMDVGMPLNVKYGKRGGILNIEWKLDFISHSTFYKEGLLDVCELYVWMCMCLRVYTCMYA